MRLGLGSKQGIIDRAGFPQVMKQDDKLTGDGHDRPLLGILAPAVGELQAPAAQVTIGAGATQDVLRGADEQASQERVAGLGDTELWVAIAGLVPPGNEPASGPSVSALGEAAGVFEREHNGHGGEGPHATDLPECASLRVVLLAEGLDLAVIGPDLRGELGDGFAERKQHGAQRLRGGGHLLGGAVR